MSSAIKLPLNQTPPLLLPRNTTPSEGNLQKITNLLANPRDPFESRVKEHVYYAKHLPKDVVINLYKDYPALGALVVAKLYNTQTQTHVQKEFESKVTQAHADSEKNYQDILANQDTLSKTSIQIQAPQTNPAPKPAQPAVTSTQKKSYLSGVRGTAMLGYQEAGAFAQILNRPIVVVKAGLIEAVYSPKTTEGRSKPPIYVVNYSNVHFEGWKPTTPPLVLRAGERCEGTQLIGGSAGPNDCLIQALKTDTNAEAALGTNNIATRKKVAEFQEAHFDTSFYIPETELAKGQLVSNATSSERLPNGFVRIAKGHYFEEGTISNGVRDGEWVETDGKGKYDILYDKQGQELSRTKTHVRLENGSLQPID